MTDREKMLLRVQEYSFAMLDLSLYLDSHPADANALALYQDYKLKQLQASEEFEAKYGSLKQGASTPESWDWINGPWPWENQAGGMK